MTATPKNLRRAHVETISTIRLLAYRSSALAAAALILLWLARPDDWKTDAWLTFGFFIAAGALAWFLIDGIKVAAECTATIQWTKRRDNSA